MALTSNQTRYLKKFISGEISIVNEAFINEINEWPKGKKIKLLILGEAPVSADRYFYKKPGNFLSGLIKKLKIRDKNIYNGLRSKGILVVDIYQFPISTKYYDNDKMHCLYNNKFIDSQLNILIKKSLINKKTKIVFRYKKLIERELYNKSALKPLMPYYLKDRAGIPISLYKKERPRQILSDEVRYVF